MASVRVEALLAEIVEAWRSSHGAIPLDYRSERLDGATVAAEPALRQAIWSLLDNAADASPDGIVLSAEVAGERLTIAVMDAGQGFTDEQLAKVGQLYQSSKGAGHGLGLFLASNVARRLGGTLEAANRSDGGAIVRLLLPLASSRTDGES
jgi:two-component system sensor histidine kinase RegB